MQTNVPQIEFTDQGAVLPEESAILAGVQADINAAFGGGVNSGLTTPHGGKLRAVAHRDHRRQRTADILRKSPHQINH